MIKCPECGVDTHPDRKFCGGCGAAVASVERCRVCDAALKPGRKFCHGCGTAVTLEAPAEELEPVAAPLPPPTVEPRPRVPIDWSRYSRPAALACALAAVVGSGVYWGPQWLKKAPSPAVKVEEAVAPATPPPANVELEPAADVPAVDAPPVVPVSPAPAPHSAPAAPSVDPEIARKKREAEAARQAAEAETLRIAEAQRAEQQRLAEAERAAEAAREIAAERAAAEKVEADRLAREEARRQATEAVRSRVRTPIAPAGPASGILIWQGSLTANQIVTVSDLSATEGKVTGLPLPGSPVILESPAGCVISASPLRATAFRSFSFRCSKKGSRTIHFRWSRP